MSAEPFYQCICGKQYVCSCVGKPLTFQGQLLVPMDQLLDQFRDCASHITIPPGEPVLHTIDRIIAGLKEAYQCRAYPDQISPSQ